VVAAAGGACIPLDSGGDRPAVGGGAGGSAGGHLPGIGVRAGDAGATVWSGRDGGAGGAAIVAPGDAGANAGAGAADAGVAAPAWPACVPPIGGLRLVAPISASTVTSARPRLRWTGAGGGPVEVQICHDRACTGIVADFDADGAEATPPAALLPGYWFWRARAAGTTDWTRPWLFRVRRRAPGYAPIANTAAEPFSDYNGDGYPDFAVQEPTAAMIYFGGAQGIASVGPIPLAPAVVNGLTFQGPGADMNGDGFSDLGSLLDVTEPAQGWPNSDALIRFGGGAGLSAWSTSATVRVLTIDYPLWIGDPAGIGDFDGDGFGDMVMTRRYGASLLRGCTPAPVPVASGNLGCGNCQLQQLAPGDFDGDGRSDLVFADGVAIGVYPGNPRGVTPTASIYETAVAVLDYDGDGFSDLLSADWSTGIGVLIGRRGGPGGLSVAPSAAPQPPPFLLAGDFNGDGRWDVIVLGCAAGACTAGPTPSYVGYGGSGGWGAPFAATVPLDPALDHDAVAYRSAVVDLNADGYDDLLVDGAYYPGSPAGLSPTPIASTPR
jgi:hypothetical protein